jgi:hypothetical protein
MEPYDCVTMALFGRPSQRDEAKAAAYRGWLLRRDPLAIASVVVGIFSLTHFGTFLIDAIAAIVLGVVALRRLADPNHVGPPDGPGLAWTGILTAAMSLLIAVHFVYRWV